MEQGLVIQNQAVAVQSSSMGVTEVKEQVNLIQHVMREVMKSGEHYGVIPGCGTKPALLKAGAEKLALTFRFAPKFEITEHDLGHGHRNFIVRCSLYHITSGSFLGEGVGSCSTMETKYRYRKAEQKCPECGQATIIRGKKEYGGGWVCLKSKGGCGAKFNDGDPVIENQEMGRIEHDNPADYWNTCLKMGKKRAQVDATLTSTAASDIFTQDIDDDPSLYGGKEIHTAVQQNKAPNTPHEQQQGDPEDPDNIKRQEIIEWCMKMTLGDPKEARNILEKETAFTGKDGKTVAGVRDTPLLTGKRLDIAHKRIHEKFDKWQEKNGSDEPEETGTPQQDELPF